jgi:hypothetical protein
MPATKAGASMISPRNMFPSHDPRVCREDFLSLFETVFYLKRIMSSRVGDGNAVPRTQQ